jgi:hypothetical protein
MHNFHLKTRMIIMEGGKIVVGGKRTRGDGKLWSKHHHLPQTQFEWTRDGLLVSSGGMIGKGDFNKS